MMSEEIVCGVCGKSFNPDNLDQVLYHETHQLMLVSSAGQGVQVGPCYACGHVARCEVLLGQSFKPHGVCDWSPSRFKSSKEGESDGQGSGQAAPAGPKA